MKKEKKLASALRFDFPKEQVPVLLASGMGEDARYIVDLASEFEIPVYEDPQLATALSYIQVGTQIPPRLYQAVAQVIAFVYQLDGGQDKIDLVVTG